MLVGVSFARLTVLGMLSDLLSIWLMLSDDRDLISKALRSESLLARTGVEASVFTPIGMRRGGISTAIALSLIHI